MALGPRHGGGAPVSKDTELTLLRCTVDVPPLPRLAGESTMAYLIRRLEQIAHSGTPVVTHAATAEEITAFLSASKGRLH